MLHLNIRSLRKHFDELCNLLDFTPLKFNSIAYIETWITPQADPNQFQISGYNIITDNRISSITAELLYFLKKMLTIVYNPPNRSQRQFLDEFEQLLYTIYLSKRKCLILGDFNINTLSKSIIPKEYLNLIKSEGFNPMVFEATRITETNISCLEVLRQK